jgi:hypothetical protein
MDREYALIVLQERMKTLKHRYQMLCHGLDEQGNDVNRDVAATNRSLLRKDLDLCMLVEELLICTESDWLFLSDEAVRGLERLMDPLERHRRLKEQCSPTNT